MSNDSLDTSTRAFIIAEAGVNHNGSMELAAKLIDAAVAAGVDAVKFQTFKTEKLVTRLAGKAGYQRETTNKNESQFEMLKKLELSYEQHLKLIEYCKQKEIMFLSTPFDEESIDMLEAIGVEIYKVSSGDLTNMPMLKYLSKKGKPIILSSGMATMVEINEALHWIRSEGNEKIAVLHCNTSYPTPMTDVNLNAIRKMKEVLNVPIGYSDHTLGIEIPIAAVAIGASIIEKHFTIDRSLPGPDHKASLQADELKLMVKYIRNVEKAMGKWEKTITKSEAENIEIARKSVVANTNITKGCIINEDNITIKRPGTGIEPKYYYEIVGKKAKRDISIDDVITWEDIC